MSCLPYCEVGPRRIVSGKAEIGFSVEGGATTRTTRRALSQPGSRSGALTKPSFFPGAHTKWPGPSGLLGTGTPCDGNLTVNTRETQHCRLDSTSHLGMPWSAAFLAQTSSILVFGSGPAVSLEVRPVCPGPLPRPLHKP